MPASAVLLCLVLTVQDGDSLRVRCDGASARSVPLSVRLHAVDAPEHGQAYGKRARQALRQMVQRRTVRMHCVDTDRYGRRVCQVFQPAAAGAEAQDVGLALVQQGLAWWYQQYSGEQAPADRLRYEAAEREARAQQRGLWREGEAAVPPWRWRQAQPPRNGNSN